MAGPDVVPDVVPEGVPAVTAEVPADAAPASPTRTPPKLSVSVRRASTALVILATLASLYTLHLARDFIVPVVVAIVIAYLLDPMVEWLQRQRVPRAVGATVVLLGMLALLLCGAYLLQGRLNLSSTGCPPSPASSPARWANW